jgi:hypothetical protein
MPLFPSSLTLEMFCLNDSPFRELAALSSTYQSLVVEVLGERSRPVEIRHACKGCEEIGGGGVAVTWTSHRHVQQHLGTTG